MKLSETLRPSPTLEVNASNGKTTVATKRSNSSKNNDKSCSII